MKRVCCILRNKSTCIILGMLMTLLILIVPSILHVTLSSFLLVMLMILHVPVVDGNSAYQIHHRICSRVEVSRGAARPYDKRVGEVRTAQPNHAHENQSTSSNLSGVDACVSRVLVGRVLGETVTTGAEKTKKTSETLHVYGSRPCAESFDTRTVVIGGMKMCVGLRVWLGKVHARVPMSTLVMSCRL